MTLAFIFSLIYKKVDFLFFGSSSAKKWWLNMFPWMKFSKFSVFYNGIKIRINQKVNKIGRKINIGFVGRIEIENNVIFFLDIAKEILKIKKNHYFKIFGDGPHLKDLKTTYQNKNIKFYGWCEKSRIFSQIDMLLITAPINNYPYAALEAKSYGIPVITCSKGDISKIIKNNIDGINVKSNERYEIIKAIFKVEKNYNFYSKNSLQRTREYDLDTCCKKFWRKVI